MSNDRCLIGVIEKNDLEQIQISISTFRKKRYLDIRTFYREDEETEDWKPTKKGISINTEMLEEFKEIVNKGINQLLEEIQKKESI